MQCANMWKMIADSLIPHRVFTTQKQAIDNWCWSNQAAGTEAQLTQRLAITNVYNNTFSLNMVSIRHFAHQIIFLELFPCQKFFKPNSFQWK